MTPLFIKSITPPATHTPTVKVSELKAAKPVEESDAAADTPKPDLKHFSNLLSLLADHGAGTGDFGPHNVEEGHHVAFAAGSFTGTGKVSATGRDGLTVLDERKREHRVHWKEVTGHFAPEKNETEKPASDKKPKTKSKDAA